MNIPSDLYHRLRTEILRCGPFSSDDTLKTIFVDERISLWRDEIPNAASPKERVNKVIDVLSDRFDHKGQNALALLLRVLEEQFDPADACHQTLNTLAYTVEETQVSTLAKPEPPALPLNNLKPLDTQEFIQRERDFASIQQTLSAKGLTVIKGESGSGKSVLALQIAHHCLHTIVAGGRRGFEAVVWVSPDESGNTLSGVYATIAHTIERPAMLKHPQPTQEEMLCEWFGKHPTLLVIDDVDKLEAAVEAFVNRVSTKANILITTCTELSIRHLYLHTLSGMSTNEAHKLISLECEKRDVLLTAEQIVRLCQMTEGLPDEIARAIARIAQLDMIDDDRIEATLANIRESESTLLQTLHTLQTSDAEMVLAALNLFPTGASVTALAQVLDIDTDRCQAAVERLHDLLLVKADAEVYVPVSQIPTKAMQSLSQRILDADTYMRWVDYLCAVFEPCAVHVDFLAENPDMNAVRPNSLRLAVTLAKAWEWCKDMQYGEQALDLGKRLCTYLYLIGEVARSIDIAEQALKLAAMWHTQYVEHGADHAVLPVIGCPFCEAIYDFETALGLRYAWSDRPDEAMIVLRQAESRARAMGNYKLDNVLEYIGSTYMRDGHYHTAESLIAQSTTLREASTTRELTVLGRFMMGVVNYRQQKFTRAKYWLSRALTLAREADFLRGISYVQNYLGNVHLALGNRRLARRCLEESQMLAETLKDYRRIAQVSRSLFWLDRQELHHQAARHYANKALDMFVQLGMTREYQELEIELENLRHGIFLDRDGTLNVDAYATHREEQYRLIDGAIEALQLLQKLGFTFVVITNQPGIAKGRYSENEMAAFNAKLLAELQQHGIHIAALEYCSDETGRRHKPEPGMLEDAAKKLQLDLSRSFMIGDKMSDMRAGKKAHPECTTILVETGVAAIEFLPRYVPDDYNKPDYQGLKPDHTAKDLLDAARIVTRVCKERMAVEK